MLVVNVSSFATPGNALPRSTGAIRRCPSDPTLSPNERAVYEYTLKWVIQKGVEHVRKTGGMFHWSTYFW